MIVDCTVESVVQAQVEAYSAGDRAAFVASYAPDAVLFDHTDDARVQGSAAIATWYEAQHSAGRRSATVRTRIISGEYVVDEMLISALDRPVGSSVAMYNVRECRIARVDFLPFQRAAE